MPSPPWWTVPLNCELKYPHPPLGCLCQVVGYRKVTNTLYRAGLVEYTDRDLAFNKRRRNICCNMWQQLRKKWRAEISANPHSTGIIQVLWIGFLMCFCSLPTYLTQQYSLDWHHISQVKWKLVSSPDAQPKEKSAFGRRECVNCHSCGVRIPTIGEGWHFLEEIGMRSGPRVTMPYKRLPLLKDQRKRKKEKKYRKKRKWEKKITSIVLWHKAISTR